MVQRLIISLDLRKFMTSWFKGLVLIYTVTIEGVDADVFLPGRMGEVQYRFPNG